MCLSRKSGPDPADAAPVDPKAFSGLDHRASDPSPLGSAAKPSNTDAPAVGECGDPLGGATAAQTPTAVTDVEPSVGLHLHALRSLEADATHAAVEIGRASCRERVLCV